MWSAFIEPAVTVIHGFAIKAGRGNHVSGYGLAYCYGVIGPHWLEPTGSSARLTLARKER
jgi:hypothetical protein